MSEALDRAQRLAEENTSEGMGYHFVNTDHLAPFEEVLAPFVVVAQERLASLAGPHYDLLAPDARAGLVCPRSSADSTLARSSDRSPP